MLESVRTERSQRLLRMENHLAVKSLPSREDRDVYLGAQLEQGQAWAVLMSVLNVRSNTNKNYTLTGNSLCWISYSVGCFDL
jgi:hypothetical protein